MGQQATVMVMLLGAGLQVQRAIVCVEKVIQKGPRLVCECLVFLAVTADFRCIDAYEAQIAAIRQLDSVAVVDVGHFYLFVGMDGRTVVRADC